MGNASVLQHAGHPCLPNFIPINPSHPSFPFSHTVLATPSGLSNQPGPAMLSAAPRLSLFLLPTPAPTHSPPAPVHTPLSTSPSLSLSHPIAPPPSWSVTLRRTYGAFAALPHSPRSLYVRSGFVLLGGFQTSQHPVLSTVTHARSTCPLPNGPSFHSSRPLLPLLPSSPTLPLLLLFSFLVSPAHDEIWIASLSVCVFVS